MGYEVSPGMAAANLCWGNAAAPRALPAWATWLVELGTAAAAQSADGLTRWIVVSVPDRRFAATLVAHGAVVTALQRRAAPPVEQRFTGVRKGAHLTWIDGSGESRFGRYLGISDNEIHYQGRVHGGWAGALSRRPLQNAASFWPAPADEEFVGGRPAADDSLFALAFSSDGGSPLLESSSIEATIVSVRAELDQELRSKDFAAAGVAGALRDTVRPRHLCGAGEHFRSVVISAAADPDSIAGVPVGGPAIFDGPGGYLRLRDAAQRETNLVIIDRWSPRADDVAAVARSERAHTWVEAEPLRVSAAPAAIEVYQWAAEL